MARMEKRSDAEINRQIELLRLQRTTIPRISGFGDNNHHSIDAQIRVLEIALKKDWLDLEEMYDESEDESRRNAFAWVLCESDDALVDEDDSWVAKAVAAATKTKGD